MKNILLLSFILFLFSCSNDDTTEDSGFPVFEIPLTNGNYWTYDIQTGGTTSRDSLYVANDVLINTFNYKKMKVKNNVATGFYSSSLNNNAIRVIGNSLLLTGNLSLNAGQTLPFNLDLELNDFIIFNADANNGQTLSTKTGTIQETINGYPLTIYYTLKSIAGNSIPNYTSPNNDTYSNVKSNKIILTAKIDSNINGFPVSILQEQDVIISEQFVAKNIGVVHTNTLSHYTLNPSLPAQILSQIPIPNNQSQTQNEFLDVYLIN